MGCLLPRRGQSAAPPSSSWRQASSQALESRVGGGVGGHGVQGVEAAMGVGETERRTTETVLERIR